MSTINTANPIYIVRLKDILIYASLDGSFAKVCPINKLRSGDMSNNNSNLFSKKYSVTRCKFFHDLSRCNPSSLWVAFLATQRKLTLHWEKQHDVEIVS